MQVVHAALSHLLSRSCPDVFQYTEADGANMMTPRLSLVVKHMKRDPSGGGFTHLGVLRTVSGEYEVFDLTLFRSIAS